MNDGPEKNIFSKEFEERLSWDKESLEQLVPLDPVTLEPLANLAKQPPRDPDGPKTEVEEPEDDEPEIEEPEDDED